MVISPSTSSNISHFYVLEICNYFEIYHLWLYSVSLLVYYRVLELILPV